MKNLFAHQNLRHARQLLCLMTALVTLTSCSTLLGKPQAGIVFHEEVSVCISPANDGVTATIRPLKCYSMREASPYRVSGSVVVSEKSGTIRFRSTFMLKPVNSVFPETPDCEGGGRLELDLGTFAPGAYQVYSGESLLVELDYPEDLPWCSSAGA